MTIIFSKEEVSEILQQRASKMTGGNKFKVSNSYDLPYGGVKLEEGEDIEIKVREEELSITDPEIEKPDYIAIKEEYEGFDDSKSEEAL